MCYANHVDNYKDRADGEKCFKIKIVGNYGSHSTLTYIIFNREIERRGNLEVKLWFGNRNPIF